MESVKREVKPLSTEDSAALFRRRSVLLALLLLALRIPFLWHPTPVHPDELAFIAGIDFPADYPVHHPGYPLWVALGTIGVHLGLQPYTAFQMWSLAASIIAPLLLYHNFRRLVADRTAWWAAFAFALCPLAWFQSTTALSYSAAAAVGIVVVGYFARAILESNDAALLKGAIALAIGLFLRPDLLIYLGPMFFVAMWRVRGRRSIASLLIVVVAVAMFALLSSHLYGRGTGPKPSLSHTVDVILGTSVFKLGLVDGLARNAVKIAGNLAWDFGIGLVILIYSLARLALRRPERSVGIFLMCWLTPGLLFLFLMHVVQGYFLLLLPAGYLCIALAFEKCHSTSKATMVLMIIAICSAAQFLFYPWSPTGSRWKRALDSKLAFQSAVGLMNLDKDPTINHSGDIWPTEAHKHESNKSSLHEPPGHDRGGARHGLASSLGIHRARDRMVWPATTSNDFRTFFRR